MRASLRDMSWQKISRSMLLVLAVFYLGFHAVSGDRGLYAWFKETRQLATLQEELHLVTAERESYERKIHYMSADSLDLDMLDEQARNVLGFADKDEIIILLPKK